jgi:bifunctional ADP-heptose synthase (sugar kinase/adenylyltransferase)
VLGDLVLDEYLWGEIARISPEAPVPVMHLHHSERSLGAGVSAIGVLGADEAGAAPLGEFDRADINRAGVSATPSEFKLS